MSWVYFEHAWPFVLCQLKVFRGKARVQQVAQRCIRPLLLPRDSTGEAEMHALILHAWHLERRRGMRVDF